MMILGMNLELDGVNAGRGGGGEVSVADDGVVCPSAVDGLPLEFTREPLCVEEAPARVDCERDRVRSLRVSESESAS